MQYHRNCGFHPLQNIMKYGTMSWDTILKIRVRNLFIFQLFYKHICYQDATYFKSGSRQGNVTSPSLILHVSDYETFNVNLVKP